MTKPIVIPEGSEFQSSTVESDRLVEVVDFTLFLESLVEGPGEIGEDNITDIMPWRTAFQLCLPAGNVVC